MRRCDSKVWTWLGYRPCRKQAKREHGGMWYCPSHDPIVRLERLTANRRRRQDDPRQ